MRKPTGYTAASRPRAMGGVATAAHRAIGAWPGAVEGQRLRPQRPLPPPTPRSAFLRGSDTFQPTQEGWGDGRRGGFLCGKKRLWGMLGVRLGASKLGPQLPGMCPSQNRSFSSRISPNGEEGQSFPPPPGPKPGTRVMTKCNLDAPRSPIPTPTLAGGLVKWWRDKSPPPRVA